MKVLITGGAGFVGSHLADKLIEENHDVTLYDNLDNQVHPSNEWPDYLNPKAKKVLGDVRDYELFKTHILDSDVIFHLAAKVGVGQSMYDIKHYTDVNVGGTTNLLDVLANNENHVKRLIVASSMSCYGEGTYEEKGTHKKIKSGIFRTEEQFKNKEWCFKHLSPVPTDESKLFESNSIYALTKKMQEEMCLSIGKTYNIPTFTLRFFNIYGTRQALSNPYTGVAAIFCGCYLSGKAPMIFEDGNQMRDFVHVDDIVQSCYLCMTTENEEAFYQPFNIGSGVPITIKDVCQLLEREMKTNLGFEIVELYRIGDIRHCFGDITKARKLLGYEPKIKFKDGLKDLVKWVSKQKSDIDISKMKKELVKKNLIK